MAQGADPHNLRGELPLRLEDALIATKPGVRLLGSARYNGTHQGQDQWVFRPQAQFNVARRWQIEIMSPLLAGPAERTGSRDVRLGFAHQFLEGRGALPNLAISANIDIPSGKDSSGADTQVEFLATKTINEGAGQDRIHFNGTWLHNADRRPNERDHHYEIVLGYSRKLRDSTAVLADYVREQEQRRGREANIVEIGLRQRMGQKVILSVGAGRGFADESPKARVTVGLEWQL